MYKIADLENVNKILNASTIMRLSSVGAASNIDTQVYISGDQAVAFKVLMRDYAKRYTSILGIRPNLHRYLHHTSHE